jgi:hypothetical protein
MEIEVIDWIRQELLPHRVSNLFVPHPAEVRPVK